MAKKNVKEDEVKNLLKRDYFGEYDWTRVIGDIDLTVCSQQLIAVPQTTFLWAETKRGKKDEIESLIQLILTIGKARTYETEIPPYFLGAADNEKIVFVDYSKVMHIFSKTDFNWNVTPSDHGTKEFKELYTLLHDDLSKDLLKFVFRYDQRDLKRFISRNFKEGRKNTARIPVKKNNFTFVYYDWVKTVKDTIKVDWMQFQKAGILDRDFFLADLMSRDGLSIKEKLKVVLEKTKYKVYVKAELGGMFSDAFQEVTFRDGQKAYNQFWNRYERPPKEVYQRYILDRQDLLVPQDIRETRGSYYTPRIWVQKAQEYIERVLGENWQDEYYVWDCAAGSGNLLLGLTNKYNVFASTLDDSDVRVMHDAIDSGRLNLVKSNVFQFDFLNDGYEQASDGSSKSALTKCLKIPESLRGIISDPEKRKKLVIYINPPYAEVSSKGEKGKKGVNKSIIHDLYLGDFGTAGRELYIQFLYRAYKEIPGCKIAEFSKLKLLQGAAFDGIRGVFRARLDRMFCVPADTFDNVVGQFPIGFKIWDTAVNEPFEEITADVYSRDGSVLPPKQICLIDKDKVINKWISEYSFRDLSGYDKLGFLCGTNGNSFQHNNIVYVVNDRSQMANPRGVWIVKDNLLPCCVYYAVRHVVEANWLNDRDQFLVPGKVWESDVEFQFDCLVYALFHGQNRITCEKWVNHWIPFYENEVNSPGTMESRFMADFLHGKVHRKNLASGEGGLFDELEREAAATAIPIGNLSEEAQAVYEAGRELWKYYMSFPEANPNASFYDIKAYFQGYKTTEKGKRVMNSESYDSAYSVLLDDLKRAMRDLAEHIEPKVYQYGFLL